jgi:hypothetical protein
MIFTWEEEMVHQSRLLPKYPIRQYPDSMTLSHLLLVCYLALFQLSAFANTTVDVDYTDYTASRMLHFKKQISTKIGKINTIKMHHANQEIVITVTEKMPEVTKKTAPKVGLAFIDFKFYEIKHGKRKLLNSGIVETNWGQEASIEKFKNASKTDPLMSLKVTPLKL